MSAALQAIKDVSLVRVSVASVSHVPVGEEAVILKQVRYSENSIIVLIIVGVGRLFVFTSRQVI